MPLLLAVFAAGYFGVAVLTRTGAQQILSLSTQGIYLYLSCFVSAYLAFLLRYETSTRIRRIAWSIVALMFSGAAGVFLNAQQPVTAVDILKPAVEHDLAIDAECANTRFLDAARCVGRLQRRVWPPLFTLTSTDRFDAVVRFDRFPDDLARYIQRAGRGDIRMLVDLYLFQVPVAFEVTLSGQSDPLSLTETDKHVLSAAQAAQFGTRGGLTFTTRMAKGSTLAIPPRSFWVRNPAYRLPYRRDAARFAGRPFAFPEGDTFLVTFQFETLEHVPLAVFF